MNWDEKFLAIAKTVASWSKDRSRKVGAVIVGPDHEIRSVGYNGFPRGVDDEVESRHQRPAKYRWTEHAERNAVYNAARVGIPTRGCTIYLCWFPCMDCARAIVQAGIIEIVAIEPDWNDPIWADDFRDVPTLLREAGVNIRYLPGKMEGPNAYV